MSALEKIKNEIALQREYPDWDSMLPDLYGREVDELIPEIADRYASESVKEYKEKLKAKYDDRIRLCKQIIEQSPGGWPTLKAICEGVIFEYEYLIDSFDKQ